MKRILGVLTILCVFGLIIPAVGQSAQTSHESSPVVQGTLMEIDGPFYVIMDSTSKEQRGHVDTSTMISDGKKLIQPCGLCHTQFLYG